MYRSKETGRLYDTEAKAKAASARFKRKKKKEEEEARELQRVRDLEQGYLDELFACESPAEVIDFIHKKAYNYWGVNLIIEEKDLWLYRDMHMGEVLFTNKVKITCIQVNTENPLAPPSSESIYNFLTRLGFTAGSGHPGRIPDRSLEMSLGILLSKYPRIRENLALVRKQRLADVDRKVIRDDLKSKSRSAVFATPEYLEIKNLYEKLCRMADILRSKRTYLLEYEAEKFALEWDKHSPPPPRIVSEDLMQKFNMVKF